VLPIVAGGGGIPAIEEPGGTLRPVDAVVDKDLAAAVLARDLGARRLAILTAEPFVYFDYRKPTQQPLRLLHAGQAADLLDDGQFPPGSMGPKIEAALEFLSGGGEDVLITSTEGFEAAIGGGPATRVVR
jgi:carbamate kinase